MEESRLELTERLRREGRWAHKGQRVTCRVHREHFGPFHRLAGPPQRGWSGSSSQGWTYPRQLRSISAVAGAADINVHDPCSYSAFREWSCRDPSMQCPLHPSGQPPPAWRQRWRAGPGARVASRPNVVPNVGGLDCCTCPALRDKLLAASSSPPYSTDLNPRLELGSGGKSLTFFCPATIRERLSSCGVRSIYRWGVSGFIRARGARAGSAGRGISGWICVPLFLIGTQVAMRVSGDRGIG